MAKKVKAGRALLALAVLAGLELLAPVGAGAQQLDGSRSVCAECHPGRSVAARGLRGGHAQQATCLSCHHAESSGAPTDRVCIGCHGALEPTHRSVGQGAPRCTSCHEIHGAEAGAGARMSETCRSCHEAPHALHGNAAGGPQCTDCHSAHGSEPVPSEPAAVEAACVNCHQAPHPSHPASAQGTPGCATCHSLSPDRATLTGAELTGTCTSCHPTSAHTHGRVAQSAPQCVDCHSFAQDPPLAQAGGAVSERCGVCHEQTMGAYLEGGHARGMSGVTGELPTCITCHGEHTGKETRLSATAQCIACHSSRRLAEKYNLPENVGASYADDFHGATVQLAADDPKAAELAPVLVCSDCHGAHEVGWDESKQIASVCLECHDRGESALAGAWLGHARVGPDHQPLIWLVKLFYYFTIPFVLGGLALNILFHLRDQRRRGARMRESHGLHRLRARLAGRRLPAVPVITRFSLTERLEHFGSMTTFILLVLTGLPQTRPDLGAARWIINLFGGIAATRVMHRTMGVLFVALLVMHVTRAILAALRKHRTPAMVPTRQDFVDTLATLRHFLQGTPRPRVGKFDFSEKFEYWGLFLGGTLMSVTGAILIFPEAVTRVLPGELVAMFRVMHGLEATFAVLVVVLWHSYGVILRPEVFPLDTSIFTGKMSVERLKEEHELEYERLFPDEAESDDAAADARRGAVA